MSPVTIRTTRCLVLFCLTLWTGHALAQDELIETTVVRNRLYTPAGRLEVTPSIAAGLVNHLTAHYTLGVGVAYNFFNTLALEGRVGWAISRQTGLARDVAEQFIGERKELTDDLQDLWQMGLHGAVGVRWAPIYGKLSLVAEVPAHFQAYLWGGGGFARLRRQSAVMCTDVRTVQPGVGVCDDRTDPADPSSASENFFHKDTRNLAPLVSGALGLRFFIGQRQGVRLELRDWVFRDQYRVDITRTEEGETPVVPDTFAPSPGFTHIVQLELGYTFLF